MSQSTNNLQKSTNATMKTPANAKSSSTTTSATNLIDFTDDYLQMTPVPTKTTNDQDPAEEVPSCDLTTPLNTIADMRTAIKDFIVYYSATTMTSREISDKLDDLFNRAGKDTTKGKHKFYMFRTAMIEAMAQHKDHLLNDKGAYRELLKGLQEVYDELDDLAEVSRRENAARVNANYTKMTEKEKIAALTKLNGELITKDNIIEKDRTAICLKRTRSCKHATNVWKMNC